MTYEELETRMYERRVEWYLRKKRRDRFIGWSFALGAGLLFWIVVTLSVWGVMS